MIPTERPVPPAARKRRSSTRTSRTPRSARWKAIAHPITPPPTITTSAVFTRDSPPPPSGVRPAERVSARGAQDLQRNRHGTAGLPKPSPVGSCILPEVSPRGLGVPLRAAALPPLPLFGGGSGGGRRGPPRTTPG